MFLSQKIDIKPCRNYTKTYICKCSMIVPWYRTMILHCHWSRQGTSDRSLIGSDQLLKCSGFSPYPLSYFLYSPFNQGEMICMLLINLETLKWCQSNLIYAWSHCYLLYIQYTHIYLQYSTINVNILILIKETIKFKETNEGEWGKERK